MNILFLISHYKNRNEILSFIRNVELKKNEIGISFFFSISDNSGDFGELEKKNVLITKPQNNLGYLGGGNHAYNSWSKIYPNQDVDWVFFCNTDLTFEGEFFNELNNITIDDDLGGIAPQIRLRGTETMQNPFLVERMPRLRILFNKIQFRSLLFNRVFYAFLKFKKKFINSTSVNSHFEKLPIYAGHGSIIIFNKRFFENGGKLKSNCFMYHEEIFIAEEIRKLNLKIYYIPNLKVIHNENSTTGFINNKKKLKWKLESANYIWKEYYK